VTFLIDLLKAIRKNGKNSATYHRDKRQGHEMKLYERTFLRVFGNHTRLMRYRIIFASFIGLVCGASTLTVFGLGMFVGPLRTEFGWSVTQITLANTIVSFSCVLSSIFQGALIDRFGSRRVVLVSMLLLDMGFSAMYFLPRNLMIFYIAWFFIPLLGVGTWSGAYAKVITSWFDRNLGLALGIASLGAGLGSAIIPVLAHVLLHTFGWRLAYVWIGALSVFIALPAVYLNLFDKPSDCGFVSEFTVTRLAGPAERYTWGAALRSRSFWCLSISFAFLGFYSIGMATHLVPMLTLAGVTNRSAAICQTLMGIGIMLGRIVAGYCLDRLSTSVVTAGSLITPILGLAGFAYFGAQPGWMYLYAFLAGAGIGAEFDLLGFYVRRQFGVYSYGKIYGSIFGFFQFGAAIGVVGFAVGAETWGGYAPAIYLTCGLLAVAAAILCSLDCPAVLLPEEAGHAGNHHDEQPSI
jgi:MFS family permease